MTSYHFLSFFTFQCGVSPLPCWRWENRSRGCTFWFNTENTGVRVFSLLQVTLGQNEREQNINTIQCSSVCLEQTTTGKATTQCLQKVFQEQTRLVRGWTGGLFEVRLKICQIKFTIHFLPPPPGTSNHGQEAGISGRHDLWGRDHSDHHCFLPR